MIRDSIKFVFFGTDDFSVTVFEELKKEGFIPALVVTAPDRPKGRGLKLAPPPAKVWAEERGVKVFQPEKLDASVVGDLSEVQSQLFIVASYGLIIPKCVLNIPPRGTLNVHPSLLPCYRGATPMESQILNAEKEIGVTIMLMDEKMDHGPIVAQTKIQDSRFKIQEWVPRAGELRKVLAEEGGKLLADVLPRWIAGAIDAVAQDESKATYSKKLEKKDGELDLHDGLHLAEAERRRLAYKNFLKIRAFDGSIGTYFIAEKKDKKIRVNVKDALFEEGKLKILRVIPEGKREMGYDEFLRGMK